MFARFAAQGGLDVIYGMADNQAAAIVQAAKAANIPLGIEKGKLIVVGSNCLKQGIAGIKAGEQYSTGTQVPTRTGLKAAEMIADHFNGKKLPKKEILPVETITKANVAKWEEACSLLTDARHARVQAAMRAATGRSDCHACRSDRDTMRARTTHGGTDQP